MTLVTFRWFVKERYIPMRRGSWSPTYKKTNTYNLEHYLIGHFGDLPLRNLSTFEIQVWLNKLVEEKDYSESVVRQLFQQHSRHHSSGEEAEVPDRRPRRRRQHADHKARQKAGSCEIDPRCCSGPSRILAIFA